MKYSLQLALGALQPFALRLRQSLAGTVDYEVCTFDLKKEELQRELTLG